MSCTSALSGILGRNWALNRDLCGYLRSNAGLRSLIEPRLCWIWQQKQWDAQETSGGWIYREPHEGPEYTSTSSKMWVCKQLCNPPSSLNHGPEFMFGSDVLASNFPCVYTAKSEAVFNIHTQKWNKQIPFTRIYTIMPAGLEAGKANIHQAALHTACQAADIISTKLCHSFNN